MGLEQLSAALLGAAVTVIAAIARSSIDRRLRAAGRRRTRSDDAAARVRRGDPWPFSEQRPPDPPPDAPEPE